MSFKESIIIPLETYRKCRFDQSGQDVDLLSSKLPSDVKMKLFNQMKIKSKRKSIPQTITSPTDSLSVKDILNKIPIKDQPYVKSILDWIKPHSHDLRWNSDHEIIIDGKVQPGSNVSEIFQYLTNNLTVTSDNDIPVGARAFHDKLMFLNIPISWIKVKLPTRSSKRSTKGKKHKASVSTGDQPSTSSWSPL